MTRDLFMVRFGAFLAGMGWAALAIGILGGHPGGVVAGACLLAVGGFLSYALEPLFDKWTDRAARSSQSG